MSGKATKAEKPPSGTIFVQRQKLSRRLTIPEGREPVTEQQCETLMRAIHRKWTGYYELIRSDAVTEALTAIDVSWSDKK